VFQLNFILFLLLRSTQSIVDDYLVFPHKGSDSVSKFTGDCSDDISIANLTWLLFPFTYVPVVIIVVIIAVMLIKRMFWWALECLNTFNVTIFCREYCKDKHISITHFSQQATPTDHTYDTTHARHFTMEFVDGEFQIMQRQTDYRLVTEATYEVGQ